MAKRKPKAFKIKALTIVVGGTRAQRASIIGEGAIGGNQWVAQYFQALDRGDSLAWYEAYRDAPELKIEELQELKTPAFPKVEPRHEDHVANRWDMETYFTILYYRFIFDRPTVVGMDRISFLLKHFLPFFFQK